MCCLIVVGCLDDFVNTPSFSATRAAETPLLCACALLASTGFVKAVRQRVAEPAATKAHILSLISLSGHQPATRMHLLFSLEHEGQHRDSLDRQGREQTAISSQPVSPRQAGKSTNCFVSAGRRFKLRRAGGEPLTAARHLPGWRSHTLGFSTRG